MDYKVSVILLTYNPDFQNLKNTINSIIKQENISVELIIADDGSEYFPYKEIENYLNKRRFQDYIIVNNSVNQGTVKNYLSGIMRASGKYIKAISPGDFLYDTDCLRKMIDYMERYAYRLCFGKAIYYCKEENRYSFISCQNPVDLKVYQNRNERKILKNYFVYQDYALGANFIVEKGLLKNSLEKIEKVVKYAEDTSVLYMLANGEKIGFYDDYIVWYEYGTGISSNANDKWNRILYNENQAVYEMVMDNCVFAQKGYRYNYQAEVIKNRYIKMMRWLMISPGSIFFWIKRIRVKKNDKQIKNISKDILYGIIK